VESWKEYQKGIIPNDEYLGRVVYQEGMKPVIELDPLSIKDISGISIEFNQVYSIRVFEEHSAVWKIFEESLKFDEDNYANIIYEVENGDYTNDIRKAAGEKLHGMTIKQYVIFTLNYYFEIVTDSEPTIKISSLNNE
jgi:hypothetical protein